MRRKIMKFAQSFIATLCLLAFGQSVFAQSIKDVNVVSIPDVTVSNLPDTQTVDGTINIGNVPGRRLVVFSRECTVPVGATNCDVTDVPPAPSGSIYVFSRVWNSNSAYGNAANILFFMSAPDTSSSTTNFLVFRSMTPAFSFGSPSGNFKLDTEFNIQATAVNIIRVIFPSPVQFESRVPFVFQAELVPLQ
jgi:hypothetical protein